MGCGARGNRAKPYRYLQTCSETQCIAAVCVALCDPCCSEPLLSTVHRPESQVVALSTSPSALACVEQLSSAGGVFRFPRRRLLAMESTATDGVADKRSSRRSAFKGVSRSTVGDGWRAFVYQRQSLVELGYFDSEIEAARGVDKANLLFARKYHGPPPELNLPDSRLSDDGHEEECPVRQRLSFPTGLLHQQQCHALPLPPPPIIRCATRVARSYAATSALRPSTSTASCRRWRKCLQGAGKHREE